MPWKRLLVRAYVDHYLHLGNTVTSRAEGSHSQLKSTLRVSTGDLKNVFEKIELLLDRQHTEHEGGIARDQIRSPHTARGPLYCQLLGRISNFALGKIGEQQHRLANPAPLPACTMAFRHSMGLLCAHQIQELLQQNQVFQLDDVHQHWYLKPQTPVTMQPLVLDPVVAQTRGRPTALKPKNCSFTHAANTRQAASSTRRDASAFEQVGVRTRRQAAAAAVETRRTARDRRNRDV